MQSVNGGMRFLLNAWQRYEKLAVKWFNSIDRAEAMAFALYTHDHGVLKITGQCFPLLPDEPKVVTGGQVLTVELTGTEQVKTATFFLRQVEVFLILLFMV